MIIEKIKTIKQPQIYPVHSNRVNVLGHPCLKFLVMERVHWDQKRPIPWQRLCRFEMGKLMEKQTIIDLLNAGIDVIHQQQNYYLSEYKITGKIDGKILIDNKVFIIEIKTLDSYKLLKFHKPEDFLEAQEWYYRGYYHQLNLYLHMAINESEKVKGLFILRSFSGDWKEIEMDYDPDRAYEILEKAIKINEHVEKGTYPAPLYKVNPEEIKICLQCDYKHLCLVEVQGMEKIVFEENNEILEMLREREALEEYAKKYEELTDKIKQAFSVPKELQEEMIRKKEDEKFFIFDKYVIKRKLYYQTEYRVPEDIKKQFAIKAPRCRISIEYL